MKQINRSFTRRELAFVQGFKQVISDSAGRILKHRYPPPHFCGNLVGCQSKEGQICPLSRVTGEVFF